MCKGQEGVFDLNQWGELDERVYVCKLNQFCLYLDGAS